MLDMGSYSINFNVFHLLTMCLLFISILQERVL